MFDVFSIAAGVLSVPANAIVVFSVPANVVGVFSGPDKCNPIKAVGDFFKPDLEYLFLFLGTGMLGISKFDRDSIEHILKIAWNENLSKVCLASIY